jgi:2-hydroxychromene-2-carboxylate isomerase
MARIAWYFDFVSPFSYLQHERMSAIEALAEIERTPVLLAALLTHFGQKGPAETPARRQVLYRFVQWLAEREGIPLRFPPAHPFNPIRALRLAIVAGNSAAAVQSIFRYLWRDGRSLDDEAGWRELCASVGVADTNAVHDPAVKEALRRNGERAIAAQVFGVPAFEIGGELFWGFDATNLVIDYLRDPERFSRGELARVLSLPVGAQRTR